jgi:hypothetical protein
MTCLREVGKAVRAGKAVQEALRQSEDKAVTAVWEPFVLVRSFREMGVRAGQAGEAAKAVGVVEADGGEMVDEEAL